MLTLHGAPGPRRGHELQELGIIHDGAVLVRDGVVQQVGTTRRVENLAEARDAVEVSAAGRVVMPGFVDSHTHLVCPPPSAPEEDQQLAARRIRTSSAKRLTARLRPQLEAMVRHGTTTVEITTCGGWDEAVDTKLLRVVSGLRNHPLDVVSSFLLRLPEDGPLNAAAADTVRRVSEQYLPKIARRRLASFACVSLGSDESRRLAAQRFLRAAAEAGLPSKVDLDAGGADAVIALANGCNVVSLDHMERAELEQFKALAGFAGITTLLPSSGFHWETPPAAGRQLVDGGAAIALASNFHPRRAPTLNMQAVIAMARLQFHLTAEEAISAATINGAHALGCAGQVGSLDGGKVADLLILNAADYHDVSSQIGANLVHLTMKRGAFIYKEGDVTRLTADEVHANC